jgi:hypothetical protein
MEKVYPLYMRDWENYPSGQRRERVTRLEKGRQVSITKITDPAGLAEYSLTTTNEPMADVGEEFETASFGYVRASVSQFDELIAELAYQSELVAIPNY